MPDAAVKARVSEPLDDLPRVSIDDLRRLGVFENRAKAYPLIYRVGKAPFRFEYCAIYKHISIRPGTIGPEECDSFDIVFSDLKFGRRAYFLDPETGARFLHLYLIEGRLAPRRGCERPYGSTRGKRSRRRTAIKRRIDRLTGEDAWEPASGARRKRLVDDITEMKALDDLPKDLKDSIAKRSQRRPRRATSVAIDQTAFGLSDMRMSAAEARQRSAEYISPSTVFSVLDYAVSKGECVRAGDPRFKTLDEPLALTDHFGRLDARELVQLWAHDTKWCRALRYPSDVADLGCWFLHAARYAQGGARVWLQQRKGPNIGKAAGPVRIVKLVQTERGRWYLECPVLRKPCDILYLRSGRFASRAAQRLVHQSQRAKQAEE
jgi:hypothetical protein